MKKTNVNMLRNVIIVLAVSCVTIAGASPLFAGQVAHWDFDEGSGTVVGDSAGINDGTVYGDPIWTTGKFGSALNFDGLNDYVNCGNDSSLALTSAITLQAWINFGVLNPGPYQQIVSKWSGSGYFLWECYEEMTFTSSRGTVVSPKLSTDTWYHVAVTYDSTAGTNNAVFYLNGTPTAFKSLTGSMTADATPLCLASGCYMNDYFKGTLDDVAIWDEALDADEISSLYHVGVQGFEGLSTGINTTFGLGYTTAKIELLSQLYADGKDGLNPENITINGTEWQYYPDALPGDIGYDLGTAYIYGGKNFIKLGSGIGEPLGGGVPELPAGAMPLIGVILSFGLRRLKRSHK